MTNFKSKSNSLVAAPRTHGNEAFKYSYDIHGILQIASMFQLPELEYFRVSGTIEDPDIRVRLERRYKERRHNQNETMNPGQRRSSTPRRFEKLIHYEESPGRFGFEVSIAYKDCVEIAVAPMLQFSLHVLYTNVVEPVLRWAMVRKGYALVHAACVSVEDQAVLVTARTDTGKTSTILRAVENYSCSFLSDDMTIVSRDGEVMSFPKPLTISNHTLNALSAVNGSALLSFWERLALQIQSRLHSKSGRGIGMKLSSTILPAATLNAIVQMLIPPPKYMVHRLIPNVAYANHAVLSQAVIIERGEEFEETLNHDQAVEVFVRNAEDAYGFPPYPTLANVLSSWQGQDLHPAEQAIVSEALDKVAVTRLRDPKFNWWQRLPVISRPVEVVHLAAADD